MVMAQNVKKTLASMPKADEMSYGKKDGSPYPDD